VQAGDPILHAGMTAILERRAEVAVVGHLREASVVVVGADAVDPETLESTRLARRDNALNVVLVVTMLDEAGVVAGVDAGACGFVRRAEASDERLVPVIEAATHGRASVPADLLGSLMSHLDARLFGDDTAACALPSGFSSRELAVLKMVAEGHDTAAIARHLSYSERTVKGVIHSVTSRLHLNNRSQAVAVAVRQGLI
jgi:DNA-binding NarL/FixJ family response regulator